MTFCNGSDYYKFNYNWVCGNMSTGDGAGVAHLGFIYDGDIEHNTILFNQATNPTIVTNGGGLLIMGAPDADPPCGLTTDQDCVAAPDTVTPSDGAGPGLVINANLILGNSADSGSGGGLQLASHQRKRRVQLPQRQRQTRGRQFGIESHYLDYPAQPAFQTATPWNAVQVTNNIIANNVAGWDGGGVSLLDALAVNIVNNTDRLQQLHCLLGRAVPDPVRASGQHRKHLDSLLANHRYDVVSATCRIGKRDQ